jgi:DNA-directed RNA polymerase specialized sigma24 family protein
MPLPPSPTQNAPLDEEALALISRQDLAGIYRDALAYAVWKITGFEFIRRTNRHLPQGHMPEDVVQEAFKRVFEGKRNWNRDRYPDFAAFIKSVVDSLISALFGSKEFQLEDYEVDPTNKSTGVDFVDQECFEAFKQLLREAAGGDVNLEVVAEGMEDGMKPGEIAGVIGIESSAVSQMKRKIQRRVTRLMLDHDCLSHWKALHHNV